MPGRFAERTGGVATPVSDDETQMVGLIVVASLAGPACPTRASLDQSCWAGPTCDTGPEGTGGTGIF